MMKIQRIFCMFSYLLRILISGMDQKPVGFWDPRKIISFQLDRRQKFSVVTVKGHAHSLAFLRLSISSEYEVVLIGMHLVEVDHLLQPLHLGGQDQDIISVGKGTKEVSTNSAAITTVHQRLKDRI